MIIAPLAYSAPELGESFVETSQSPRQAGLLRISLPIACFNLVLDFYILILPIAVVQRLQFRPKKIIGIEVVILTEAISDKDTTPPVVQRHRLTR